MKNIIMLLKKKYFCSRRPVTYHGSAQAMDNNVSFYFLAY